MTLVCRIDIPCSVSKATAIVLVALKKTAWLSNLPTGIHPAENLLCNMHQFSLKSLQLKLTRQAERRERS